MLITKGWPELRTRSLRDYETDSGQHEMQMRCSEYFPNSMPSLFGPRYVVPQHEFFALIAMPDSRSHPGVSNAAYRFR